MYLQLTRGSGCHAEPCQNAIPDPHPAVCTQAVEFARNYTELTTEMGFAPTLAAGALMKHANKMEDAADACLAVSSS